MRKDMSTEKIAVITRTSYVAKELVLPEGFVAFGLFASVCGQGFDDIHIMFLPETPKELSIIMSAWHTRLLPGGGEGFKAWQRYVNCLGSRA